MKEFQKNRERGVLRVAAVHDLSCFGRCALTVVIPTLSAMGAQTVPIPTALLSTHTGGFTDMYFEDLTDRMKKICDHLFAIGVEFDAIYTGFLGSEAQISVVSELIDRFGESCPVFVDPVMGDDGELYSTYTPPMVDGMRALCKKADIITPNITEACLLADVPYPEGREFSRDEAIAFCRELCRKIKKITDATTVLTGLHFEKGLVGTYVACGGENEFLHEARRVGRNYPGTGDLFASVLVGEMLRGSDINSAASRASDFTRESIEFSEKCPSNVREGVSFEPLLHKLRPKG